MKINNIEVGELFLAPMAGVTEVGFRNVAKLCGADLTVTEMVNSKALKYNNKNTLDLVLVNDIEKPRSIQLFGNDAQDLARVCESDIVKNFDFIDFNFGCPAPKIVKNGEGSALLKDLKKLENILTECKKVAIKPITAKFRTGFNNGENVAVDVAKICEDCGVSAITVHGRTREQMYSGKVDLDTIAKVKASVKIPVIGNGDVVDMNSLTEMRKTGVDGVMIGRGALGQPWIFNELKGIKTDNKFEMIRLHVETLRKYFPEKFIVAHMRKHFLWYLRDTFNVAKLRAIIATSDDVEKSLEIIKSTFSSFD